MRPTFTAPPRRALLGSLPLVLAACGTLLGTRLDPLYAPVPASECPPLVEQARTDSTSTAMLRTAPRTRGARKDPPIPGDQGIPKEGAVTFEFVVDTSGRVDLESVRLIESTHPAFAAAARAVIPVLRYEPARLRQSGCAIPATLRWKARFDGPFVVSGH